MELARISLLLGRLEQAEKICRDELITHRATAYADYPAFCLIHLGLANVLREKKSWDEAEIHLHSRVGNRAKKRTHVLPGAGLFDCRAFASRTGQNNQAQDDLRCGANRRGYSQSLFE
jgi:hypothetical protein